MKAEYLNPHELIIFIIHNDAGDQTEVSGILFFWRKTMTRVRERREQLRVAFSQNHLARLADIPQSRISLIERGLIEPRSDERERIAQALGCSEEDLWPTCTELAHASGE
jgi:DNA-binding XRE family transcriptional regulator